jgi:type I restriction enzyme S subunit
MNNKKTLVPKLRFPEFWDAGEWDSVKLKTLTKVITKGTTPTSVGYQFIENGINFIKIESITKEGFIDISKIAYISKECNKALKRSRLEENDILFSIAGALGVVAIIKNDVLPANTNQALAIVRLKNKDSLGFLSNFLRTYNIQAEIRRIKAGAAQANISLGQLGDFDILLSGVKEQQKIANCLSSLDALIAAQTEKIGALKTHKKGLMQQLFPREGETVARLRFPEFRDAGEWEEKPLSAVFSIFQGYAFSSKDSVIEGTRWLKIADVGIQYMNDSACSYLPATYKDEYNKFSVKLGDYVIALTRPILSKRLKISKVDAIYDGALLNQRVGKLVTDENKDFVYYLLQTSALVSGIEKNIAGNDPPNLSSQQIGDIITRVPLSDEQQKIADCLSSLDALIAAQKEKLGALKIHKKGLMQQLFPSPETVGV